MSHIIKYETYSKQLKDLIGLFERATQFTAGGVVGDAYWKYSCCCVVCNCCVVAFVFRFCKTSGALFRSLIKFCCRCILPILI